MWKTTAPIFLRQYPDQLRWHRCGYCYPRGRGHLESSLLGKFNLANLLAIIGTAGLQGFALEKILEAVNGLNLVDGRMELVDAKAQPIVLLTTPYPDAERRCWRWQSLPGAPVVFGWVRSRYRQACRDGQVLTTADNIVVTRTTRAASHRKKL